jgi:hypothetical protein
MIRYPVPGTWKLGPGTRYRIDAEPRAGVCVHFCTLVQTWRLSYSLKWMQAP